MSQTFLSRGQTSVSAFVEEAEQWARHLVRRECRFPGDYLPAMRRVASRAKVSFGLLWSLHYAPPKSLSVEKYAALWKLFADGHDQRRKYEVEREATQPRTWLGEALMRQADRLGREEAGPLNDE